MFSNADIEDRLREVLNETGLLTEYMPLSIVPGKIVRFKTSSDKPGKKSGAYCVFCDERPAGWVCNWKTGEKTTFTMNNLPPLSSAESERLRLSMEKERVERARERERAHRQIAVVADRMWKTGKPADEKFPYLQKKHVPPFGLRSGMNEVKRDENGAERGGNTEVLYVPLFSVDTKKLVNLQQIYPTGKKYALSGGGMSGVFSPIGKNDSGPILICEGWATGATLHLISGYTVICSMNAGNLPAVTRGIRVQRPDRDIIICADNDWETELRTGKNPGRIAACKAAEAAGVGAPVYPDFSKEDEGLSDWNDYFVTYGLDAAKEHFDMKCKGISFMEPVPENTMMDGALFPDVNIKTGRPLGTIENVEALANFYKIDIRYNEITKAQEIFFPGRDPRLAGDNKQESDVDRIISLAARHEIPTSRVASFVDVIANDNSYNPVREWISSKKWDGVPRLTEFIGHIRVRQGFDANIADMMIRKWLVSAVAAAFEEHNPDTPPFSACGILVLQGEQGCGKTTWFRKLAPMGSGWIGESKSLDPTRKDSLIDVLRVWIAELGELESTLKKERALLKAFITNTFDTIRMPYARKPSVFPRRTVFGASVNQSEFLSDETGNRRFWCIPVESINNNHVMDIQQVWAEVYELYKTGYKWYPANKSEEMAIEQNTWKFMFPDPIMDLVLQKYDWATYPTGPTEGKTATQVLLDCGIDNPKTPEVRQCGVVLRKLTGKDPKKNRVGARCYEIPVL